MQQNENYRETQGEGSMGGIENNFLGNLHS